MSDFKLLSTLARLPADVHSLIWMQLALSDIAALQQVCKEIRSRVTEDKQLWITILHDHICRRRRPLPTYLRPLYEVSASDIQGWIKQSFTVEKNYQNGLVRSSRTTTYEGITWVKLIRGRWCLVASADLSESRLSVWDISSSDLRGPCTELSLAGPVTDGIVEDAGSYVHAAVTIGTSIPFILLLDVSKNGDRVWIQQLHRIPRSSHVRLLHGPLIGYAVKNGVDECPQITDWEKKETRPLCFPTQDRSTVQLESITAECPLIERRIKPESCCAMWIWKNYLIVVLLTRMHIFSIAESSYYDKSSLRLDDISWLVCLALPYFTVEAFFSDVTGTLEEENLIRGSPCLQIILREGVYLLPIVLYCIAKEDTDEVLFAIDDVLGTACPKRGDEIAARFVIGSNMRTVIWVGYPRRTNARSYVSMYLATLSLDSRYAYMSMEEQDNFAAANEPKMIMPDGGIPLLHTLSSCDFDDGRGIAVLCSITGELCVLDFSGQCILSRGSIQDEIPCSVETTEPYLTEALDRVKLDLPVDYYLRDKSWELYRVTTPEIAAVANQLWMEPFPVRRDIPGWSNDWSNFPGVCLWLPAWPRWGPHDLIYDPGTLPSLRIRSRLYILGDMIPVLYNEQNQGRDIFRSGERMYLAKYVGDSEDDWDFEEFESRDILGMLPFTYSEFLALEMADIVFVINSRDVQINLVDWLGVDALMVAQYQLSLTAFYIRSYFRKKDGILIDLRTMESWSEAQWDKYSHEEKRAHRDGYLETYFTESNRLSWF